MMKKLLALLMALLMVTPAMAAEDVSTYDFGDFILTYGATDVLQVGEKVEGGTLFTFFPQYDDSAIFHDNITTTWSSEEGLEELKDQAEAFANEVLSMMVQQMDAAGVTITNPMVYFAEFDEESGSLMTMTGMTVDYTSLVGFELVTDQMQVQVYFPAPSGGTYVFTFTSDSKEKMENLIAYMDNIEFKD